MPAQSVDPRIDEGREQPAVQEDAGHDAREESQGELDPAHRAAAELTARTYPAGEPGSRCGSDQRAVMPASVRAGDRDRYSAVWAMSSGSVRRGARIHTSCAVVAAPTLDRAFARWCFTIECDRPSRTPVTSPVGLTEPRR